jgi:hypothetical protein
MTDDCHSDSVLAELVKRANAKRVTLFDYISQHRK